MDLDWRIARAAGTAFVSLTLSNPGPGDRRVRVANELDGDPLPPRVDGIPAAGWTGGGYETVVPAGDAVAVGYACEAPAAEPPASVVATDVVDDKGAGPAVAEVARDLRTHRPPRAAVPMLDSSDAGAADSADAPDSADSEETQRTRDGEPAGNSPRPPSPSREFDDREAAPPAPVTAWLEKTTRLVRRVERFEGASVDGAARELADLGGTAGARDLRTALAGEEERLRVVAARATELADRAGESTVPVEALAELS